jgi:hypothetical protein
MLSFVLCVALLISIVVIAIQALYDALATAPAAPGFSPALFTVSVGEFSCSKAECFVRDVTDMASLLAAVAART